MPARDEPTGEELRRRSFAFNRMLLLSLLTLSCLIQWLPIGGGVTLYRNTFKQMWPQTWSFFTDVSGVEEVTVYRWPADHGEAPEPLTVGMNGRASLGGLRRSVHAQIREIARVSMQIPDPRWTVCPGGRLTACLRSSARPPLTIVNTAPEPTLCGGVLFVVEYRGADRDARRTERLTAAEVLCKPQ